MKSSDLEEAELKHAAGVLHAAVSRFCEGRPMDEFTIAGVRDMIDLHTRECRARHIDFPTMNVIVFVRFGALEIVRKDWGKEDVGRWVMEMMPKYPGITSTEIAEAIQQAWPDYVRSLVQ